MTASDRKPHRITIDFEATREQADGLWLLLVDIIDGDYAEAHLGAPDANIRLESDPQEDHHAR